MPNPWALAGRDRSGSAAAIQIQPVYAPVIFLDSSGFGDHKPGTYYVLSPPFCATAGMVGCFSLHLLASCRKNVGASSWTILARSDRHNTLGRRIAIDSCYCWADVFKSLRRSSDSKWYPGVANRRSSLSHRQLSLALLITRTFLLACVHCTCPWTRPADL